jgi:hypothetical protein
LFGISWISFDFQWFPLIFCWQSLICFDALLRFSKFFWRSLIYVRFIENHQGS